MSQIYVTEPPTNGKVLLRTSAGDIDIELWPKEAPKACRNFIQLCMEGNYDDTVFHRVIKDFMIQGGDPTGTGSGGESIYGPGGFPDEVHSRIRFNHRGQVAMANDNATPGSNGSQFFFTLGACDWLAGKHTIFGKVAGNTIFNVLRMGEADVDEATDRPEHPERILGCEILSNPFEDIQPRKVTRSVPKTAEQLAADAAAEKKRKRKKTKDLKLLSFGDDAEDEEGDGAWAELNRKKKKKKKGGIGSHDLLDSDATLSKELAVEGVVAEQAGAAVRSDGGTTGRTEAAAKASKAALRAAVAGATGAGQDATNFAEQMRLSMVSSAAGSAVELPSSSSSSTTTTTTTTNDGSGPRDDALVASDARADDGTQRSPPLSPDSAAAKAAKAAKKEAKAELKRRKAEYREQRAKLKADKKATRFVSGAEAASRDAQVKKEKMLTPLEQMRAKYQRNRAEHGDRQQGTMDKLAAFQEKMKNGIAKATSHGGSGAGAGPSKEETAAYRGQVTEVHRTEGGEDVDADGMWMATKLKFQHHIDDKHRGFQPVADDYAVVDPREERRREEERRSTGYGGSSGGGGRGEGSRR